MTQWFHGGSDEGQLPLDPRVAAEDRVRAFYDGCSEFELATLRWLLGVAGMTAEHALEIRRRTWAHR